MSDLLVIEFPSEAKAEGVREMLFAMQKEQVKPHWSDQLSSEEAVLAARYATLKINGFPSWLSELAAAKPAEVRAVLMGEVEAELADAEAVSNSGP